MNVYVIAGILGGLINLYLYFWIFYGPDVNVLREFWKDVLQNSPTKKKSSFKRMNGVTTITAGRFSFFEVSAYPTPSVFWLKIGKHLVIGIFCGVAILRLL